MYNVTPGAGPILTPGYNLNNLGRGQLDKAVYQISKGWAFLFQIRYFSRFFLYKSMLNVGPWAGPCLAPVL